jgi:hypothetical protein
VAGLIDAPLNPYFERIFETGVDEMRWDDMSKNEMLWPSFAEAHTYRQQVYAVVRDLIATHPDLADGHPPSAWTTPVGALPGLRARTHPPRDLLGADPRAARRLVQRPAAWPALYPAAGANCPPGIDYPAGRLLDIPPAVSLASRATGPASAGTTNTASAVSVQAFRAEPAGQQRRLPRVHPERRLPRPAVVDRSRLGLARLSQQQVALLLGPEGPAGLHRYRLRTLFETIPMPWNWPAEVNAHEAAAYCAWRSARDGQPCRLPTEAEHNALRDPAWAGSDPAFRMDGATLGREIGWNSQLAHGSPWPVDAGSRPSGAHDVFGNVWQWHGDDFNCPAPASIPTTTTSRRPATTASTR